MKVTLKINQAEFAGKSREAFLRATQRRAKMVGALLVQQTKMRFENSGDEEVRWPDLWINNNKAVSQVSDKQGGTDAVAKREGEVIKAQKRIAKNPTKKNINLLNIAKMIRASGNAGRGFRAGGKPLQNTGGGGLEGSINSREEITPNGFKVYVGSPLPYAKYQNDGFSTKGPNYVPLTRKGAAKPPGANPDDHGLVRGYDYIMFWRGVRVPARPFIRITQRDLQDIRETITQTEGR